ncbi:MAG TPA: DNA mismatch repair endonuclease MutL, partial [Chloroflexia bacterium]|nr:DNA mismatch repair endonuclease MutL [Chloroflexia bacterium]
MPIQLLEPSVAAKIAAGEVIERPASVIKELMDNSIDAGANEIRVEIRGGGQPFLRITDNGRGIPGLELPLAFVRHATSKIHTAEELFALHTLGFRGEALASAAAVGRVTITTRTPDEEVGTEMTVEGGVPGPPGPRGTPRGTVVTVRDLFFNVPARLKFLKSAPSEAAHVSTLVQQYALAYPAIRFVLTSEGKQVFASPGNGDLRDAIRQVYGQEIAGSMLPVGQLPASEPALSDDPFADWVDPDALPGPRRAEPAATRDDDGDPQGVKVWGYVSPPAVSRTNRQAQHFFVNGRAINSRMLGYALEEAYHSLQMVGRHPIAVLNVRVDPGDVDANVHPTKSEVKFRQERAVFQALQKAVREALAAHSPVPSFGTRGAEGWKLPETGVLLDEAADDDAGGPPSLPFVGGSAEPLAPPRPAQEAHAQGDLFGGYAAPALGWTGAAGAAPATDADALTPDVRPADRDAPAPPLEDLGPLPGVGRGGRLPALRVVGQVSNTYIISEGPDGMFLIDQHAAHERVLYERFDREVRAGRGVAVQPLLHPLEVDLTARQRAEIEPVLPLLRDAGFDLQLAESGRHALLIRAVPAMYADRVSLAGVLEMIDELLVGSPADRWRDQLVITLACHSAVRAGKSMGMEEMRALVGQLEECQFP